MAPDERWLVPSWPAPAHVRALSTTRHGGVSAGPYGLSGGKPGGLNLGTHVGDEPAMVARNRARLEAALPAAPNWLEQVHGCDVVIAAASGRDDGVVPRADACIASRAEDVCAVMTADCLPVLLCDRAGTVVGAAHAGWRGLCAGVIETTLARMAERAGAVSGQGPEWLAWLGPAIGPDAFEVGEEVRAAFIEAARPEEKEAVARAFRAASPGKFLADIYQLAMIRLARAGCTQVFGGDRCTVAEAEDFYSYRRDGVTGRMASVIWLSDPASPA